MSQVHRWTHGRSWRSTAVFSLTLFVALALLVTLAVTSSRAQETQHQAAQLDTGFTYQGQLQSSGTPYSGTCDLQFSLWDALNGGSQIGTVQTKTSVTLLDGYFTVLLDFGPGVFKGDARWLALKVRCPAGSGSYTALNPRQPLTPTPYALALPGLWTQPNAASPSLIGGYSGNTVKAGVEGATIGGGGSNGAINHATDHYTTIGGGINNVAGTNNSSLSDSAYATVAGGEDNLAHRHAAVGGGASNAAAGLAAAISGGWLNTASGQWTTVAGGSGNLAEGESSAVGGGHINHATGGWSTIGGGEYNQATADYTTIGGGGPADTNDATTANFATDNYSTVGGGAQNLAGTDDGNPSDAAYATVAGGEHNTAGRHAAVGGGASNEATGTAAAISGGWLNTASGSWSAIPGGSGNTAAGQLSFAAGHWASADSTGCFVWGDSTESDRVTCSVPNRTIFRSSGGFYIYSNAAMTTGVYLAAGSSQWQPISTQTQTESASIAEGETVLVSAPASSASVHDASGVALVTIQALYARNQELEAQHIAQQAQIDDLTARLAVIESQTARPSDLPLGWLAVGGLFVVGVAGLNWRRRAGGK